MVKEKEIQKFINILANTVKYNYKTDIHKLGELILTNTDMKKMCSTRFGKDYDILNNTQRTKVRKQIFKALRGEFDDNG